MEEVYLYFKDIHARMLGIHEKYSPMKICNAFYALKNDMGLGKIQPPDLQEHIIDFNEFEQDILTDLIDSLDVGQMEELQSMFETNDRKENIYPSYTALSCEYLFLNAVHRYAQPNTNELAWLLESKMHVAFRLLAEPSPHKDGKMGLPNEASQVIQSLTGYQTDGADEIIQKTRSIFSILPLNALNKLSSVLSSTETVSDADVFLQSESKRVNVNYPSTLFERYRYYNNSHFSVHDDPYATLNEQKEIIEKLKQFSKNLKNSPLAVSTGSINRTIEKIQDNIRNNQNRITSAMHFNLS